MKLQGLVGKSLVAVLNIMHAFKNAVNAGSQLEPQTIFEVANDATKLLISVYFERSQVHRE